MIVNFLEGIGDRIMKPELKKYRIKVETTIKGCIEVEAYDEDDAEDRANFIAASEVEWSEPKDFDYCEVEEC